MTHINYNFYFFFYDYYLAAKVQIDFSYLENA